MPKYALITTYNKEGISNFAYSLTQLGWTIISSGGTANFLKKNGIDVIEVSSFTQFPEILDGRVKTLHPKIHAAILSRNIPSHKQTMEELNFPYIDLVAVNLYPFLYIMQKTDATYQDKIEMIDIGGPTLIRAAAKNHERVTVVCDPEDYPMILSYLKNGEVPLEIRRSLASKVFEIMSRYDEAVAQFLRTGGTK